MKKIEQILMKKIEQNLVKMKKFKINWLNYNEKVFRDLGSCFLFFSRGSKIKKKYFVSCLRAYNIILKLFKKRVLLVGIIQEHIDI